MDVALSTSAFNDAARCMKRYQYRWVEGLVPPPKDIRPTLRRGVWIHRALQLLDEGRDWRAELDVMEGWAFDHQVDPNQIMQIRQETEELVEDYTAFWAGHDDGWGPWTTEDTEARLTWQPREDITLSATLDALKRDSQGRLWVWERKTTAEIPDSDWRTVDPQTMLQFYLAQQQGLKPRGIMFDYVLTRPSPRLRVKNNGYLYAGDEDKQVRARHFPADEMLRKGAPASYVREMQTRTVADAVWFQRYPTMRPDENVAETLKDLVEIIRRVKWAEEKGYYPRSVNLLDCRLFCPYGKLCMREYQLGRPSPALREEYTVPDSPEMYAMGRSEL